MILDGVRDHIIPHMSGKKTASEMWEALKRLHKSDNKNRKMVLRDKMRTTKMSKTDIVVTYLTKIMQVHDEISTIGEIVLDHEMVRMVLNGVTEPWKVFIEGIVAHENLPKWDYNWDDFIQEEIRREALNEALIKR